MPIETDPLTTVARTAYTIAGRSETGNRKKRIAIAEALLSKNFMFNFETVTKEDLDAIGGSYTSVSTNGVNSGMIWVNAFNDSSVNNGPLSTGKLVCYDPVTGRGVTGINDTWWPNEYTIVGRLWKTKTVNSQLKALITMERGYEGFFSKEVYVKDATDSGGSTHYNPTTFSVAYGRAAESNGVWNDEDIFWSHVYREGRPIFTGERLRLTYDYRNRIIHPLSASSPTLRVRATADSTQVVIGSPVDIWTGGIEFLDQVGDPTATGYGFLGGWLDNDILYVTWNAQPSVDNIASGSGYVGAAWEVHAAKCPD